MLWPSIYSVVTKFVLSLSTDIVLIVSTTLTGTGTVFSNPYLFVAVYSITYSVPKSPLIQRLASLGLSKGPFTSTLPPVFIVT